MEAPRDEGKIERLRRAMYSRSLSGRLHTRARHALHEERSEVGEDWERAGEAASPETSLPLASFPAMKRPSPARRALRWLLLASVVFFVGALTFFAYYLFWGSGTTSTRNIDIAVTGPLAVAGGEPVDLEITVTNKNSTPLELADLVITYPQGTRSVSDLTTPLPSVRATLGTIEAGGIRRVKASVVFTGKEGERADVKVDLEYRLAGSNALFVASSDYGFTFSSSPLSIAVQGNAETVSGQPFELSLNVSSNINVPVADVLLSAAYPFGFTLSSADPAPDASGLWHLGALSPGQTRTITVRGVLTGEAGDVRVFHFQAGTRDVATSTSLDTPLADTSLPVSISEPFLGLSISVNDASGTSPVIVSPGDTVNVSIAYRNNLPTEIRDAIVVAKLSGLGIDGASVLAERGFYRSTDSALLWNKTTDPELVDLPPGASGTLAFSFKMPSSAELQGIRTPSLDITVNGAGRRVAESGVPQNLQSTASQKIRLASDLAITSQGLYYANPFGSSGAMPPKAEVETSYAVVLSITNTTNVIHDAIVTATLPPYVRWKGSFRPDSERVQFDDQTGTMTWQVGDIASGAGLGGTEPRQIGVSIGFTPSASQIGTEPPLLQNITLTGTDAATGASVQKSAPDVTTNIAGDPGFSSANAAVVK